MRKQSKRVAITKRSIETAYLDILSDNSDGKMTVKEVCTRSGVNRTTFYKYYNDLADLGHSVRQGILKELEEILDETIPEDFADMFEFVSQFVMHVYRDDRMKRFFVLYREKEFREKAKELTNKHYLHPKFGRVMSDDVMLQIEYCHAAFVGLLELWIANGLVTPPEKITNCIITNSKRILQR